MWTITNATMIHPVAAITIFLPIVERQKSPTRPTAMPVRDGVASCVAKRLNPPGRYRLQCDRLHRPAHGVRALRERRTLIRGQLDLVDLLEPLAAELARYAEEEILQPVLAREPRGARENAMLVERDALAHLHRRGGRRVVGRARLQVLHDLRTAGARALDDLVERLAIEQLRHRNAADRRVGDEGDHRV